MICSIPRRWRWFRGLLAAGCMVAALAPGSAFGQHGAIERNAGEVSNVTHEVSQEIYSPFCPGKTIAMCPSGGASKVRQDIQKLARQGKTKNQIKDQILAEYGQEYRVVQPPASDDYPLIAILAAAFVACLIAIWLFAARRASRGDESSDHARPEEDMSPTERAYLAEVRGEYRE